MRDHPEWADAAAAWFHQKWGIPEAAYAQSMAECIRSAAAVPQWYIVEAGQGIAAGAGVIHNDFHNRRDLTPNLCALYVEKAYRRQGIAGALLQAICEDCSANGIHALYLLTSHTSFYERYGWEFYCMVQGDGEPEPSRMYRRQIGKGGIA